MMVTTLLGKYLNSYQKIYFYILYYCVDYLQNKLNSFIFLHFPTRIIENLEQTLEKTDVNETTYLSSDVVNVLLYKNTDDFKGLEIQANNTEVKNKIKFSAVKKKK